MRPISRAIMQHFKCRNGFYPRTNDSVQRFPVPNDKVSWATPFPDYKPADYTTDYVLKGPVWADKELSSCSMFHWNQLDGDVDRRSHCGEYAQDAQGRPLNPEGRTGVQGRGCLGRWGPNHAADPIVTRWKRDGPRGPIAHELGKPVMQFVAILRGDCKEWAIPGGMVDPGEKLSKTLQREFFEEALDSGSAEDKERAQTFFDSGGWEVYKGYVDDPRNTDNSWMETVAVNYHDEDGSVFENINLKAGDDAVGVQWKDISAKLELYASHLSFIQKVAQLHNAHWEHK